MKFELVPIMPWKLGTVQSARGWGGCLLRRQGEITEKDEGSWTLGRAVWPGLEDGLKERQKQGHATSQARIPGPETRVVTVRLERRDSCQTHCDTGAIWLVTR